MIDAVHFNFHILTILLPPPTRTFISFEIAICAFGLKIIENYFYEFPSPN